MIRVGKALRAGGDDYEGGAMKHIGVREFKDRANALLSADEPLIIERHGRAIGAYYYNSSCLSRADGATRAA